MGLGLAISRSIIERLAERIYSRQRIRLWRRSFQLTLPGKVH